MAINKVFLVLTFIFCGGNVSAQQNDPVALRINGRSISKSVVEKAYQDRSDEGETMRDFLESYIDLQLNLEEAQSQRLDTTANYQRSYSSFKIQLSENYIQDADINKQISKYFLDRMKEDVEVNHTFIPFEKKPLLPADTVATYQKALTIKKELEQKGFADKKKYADITKYKQIVSDLGAESGYLGWLTTFTSLPIEVEDVIYSINLKEISRPIRSKDGYHIVQVLNKRPAVENIQIEQVSLSYAELPASQASVDSLRTIAEEIYKDLMSNSNGFGDLCKMYNKANGVNSNDCDFGEYGLNASLPPVFLNSAFALQKIGDLTPPIETDFGFHFIRLTNKIPHNFTLSEDSEKRFVEAVARGNRSVVYTKIAQKNLSDKFNLSINQEAYGKLLDMAHYTNPTDSLFIEKIKNNKDDLFTIDNDITYQVNDFAAHLNSKRTAANARHKNSLSGGGLVPIVDYTISTDILNNTFNTYASLAIESYADSTLESRVPEFKNLMDLYMNGTLLYELKKNNIWNKAKTDAEGLSKKFEQNKSKYNNTWKSPKDKGAIFYCKDEATAEAIKKMFEKEKKDISSFLSKVDKKYNSGTQLVIYQQGIWDQKDNPQSNGELKSRYKNLPHAMVLTKEIKNPESYLDVKAEVEADYQNQLEEEWQKKLRKKYSIDIVSDVINTIK